MTTGTPSVGARLSYGWRVVRQAAGVLRARGLAVVLPAHRADTGAANVMFNAARASTLEWERSALECFDLYLYDVMNSRRLAGQIVFEYGTLLRAFGQWQGLRVLDVGTGGSTFPRWLSRAGAVVTTFDLSKPAEKSWGGFQQQVNNVVSRRAGAMRAVTGSMRALPFSDASFDVVTSLSVLEHLDTDLPARTFVPYVEQQRRLANVMDEMIRITKPGGFLYITSECCDFERATKDGWKQAYYYDDGPALSGAWPVQDVSRLFYEYVEAHGCVLAGGSAFVAENIARPDHWTWRGRYFSGFSMLARKQ